MEVVYYKACPRCQGDMHKAQDVYGHYKECLQCGYILNIDHESKKRDYASAEALKPGRRKRVA